MRILLRSGLDTVDECVRMMNQEVLEESGSHVGQNVIGRDSLNDLADDRPCPLGVVPNELSEFVGRREVFGVCTVPHACCCMGNVCSDEIFIFHEASSTRQWDRRWTTTLARNPAMATDSGGRRKTSIQQEYRRILARARASGWFRWHQL